MLAAVLYGKEDVRMERIPIPAPAPGEVLVRIGAALTCGTDVKVFRRGYHALMIRPPAVFGHEFAGTIERVGEGVAGFAPGDRVVAANSAPCDACFYCRRDRTELCEDLVFVNGAYAEYLVIPARIVAKNLLRVPSHLSFEEAALTEPLACAVRGMEDSPARKGDTVAVLGLGPIGLLFVRLCHLAGATVIAAGRRAERLTLARTLGADYVLDATGNADIPEAVRTLTEGGRGADLVVEAVGLPEVWEQAIACARKAGCVSLFGGCPAGSAVSVDTHRIHYEELTLRGTFHHTPAAIRTALALIASGEVPARDFLQSRAALTAVPAVLASLARGGGAVKTVIETIAQE